MLLLARHVARWRDQVKAAWQAAARARPPPPAAGGVGGEPSVAIAESEPGLYGAFAAPQARDEAG